MSTSVAYRRPGGEPGSARAKAAIAAGVIFLSSVIAGFALAAAIAFGTAIEAPGGEPTVDTQPVGDATTPITNSFSSRSGAAPSSTRTD